MTDRIFFTQKAAADLMSVSARYLREEADIRPRELPGHGKKKRPLLRYHIDDIRAQIARWNEEQRGGSRRKA